MIRPLCMILVLAFLITGCAEKTDNTETPPAAAEQAQTAMVPVEDKRPEADAAVEGTFAEGYTDIADEGNASEAEDTALDKISDEEALAAIRNYCYKKEPGLKEDEESGMYTIYWEIASSDENEVVVLYRSYTAAQVRYYIDRSSGDTYVTEFVEGITEQEERTDESFNIREYME